MCVYGSHLLDNDTLDKAGVLELAANFAVELDELKVDVPRLKIGDAEHSVHGHFCKLTMASVHTAHA